LGGNTILEVLVASNLRQFAHLLQQIAADLAAHSYWIDAGVLGSCTVVGLGLFCSRSRVKTNRLLA